MENASHALLIAGGILLAILIITMLVYMLGNINEFKKAEAEEKEIEYLAAWNSEWQSYNKSLLYGAEVLSVVNKAQQNNREYENNEKYTVEIKIIENNRTVAEIKQDGTITNKIYIEKRKTNIFRCKKMQISQETGRIKWIEFEYVE